MDFYTININLVSVMFDIYTISSLLSVFFPFHFVFGVCTGGGAGMGVSVLFCHPCRNFKPHKQSDETFHSWFPFHSYI